MSDTQHQQQVIRARETLAEIEQELAQINSQLESQPDNAVYHQAVKDIMLDLKITQNEIEHLEMM